MFLDAYPAARALLLQCRFRDRRVAERNLEAMTKLGLSPDVCDWLLAELGQLLPGSADADMALNNLERFFAGNDGRADSVDFLRRTPRTLAILVQIFSTSQYFSNLIIETPETFDYVRSVAGSPFDPNQLKGEILTEIRSADFRQETVLAAIRRHRSRELLSIGFRDIIMGEPLEEVTRSIADLAECLIEVALTAAYRRQSQRWGEPRSREGRYSRLVVLGLGKLGGRELNYSSDIDLIVIYEEDGQTDGRSPSAESISNDQFFTAVVQDMVNFLSMRTAKGLAYRVDLRLRPHGGRAPLCLSKSATLAYYDRHGRTWERQALVKARPVAGYKPLGQAFLRDIEPFVYRRYLTFVEINEIKSIKRQIERTVETQGREETNLKTGRGGIRDIEFIVQFLQLLNGGVHRELRQSNTLACLAQLRASGCLFQDEHSSLDSAYRFLRKAEHRLQFMFDLQTHSIPESATELDKLAIRLGYASGSLIPPREEFLSDLRAITDRTRTLLRYLMTDLFPESPREMSDGMLVSDLILDPEPAAEMVQQILGPYRFSNVPAAYKNLMQLGTEEVAFLSTIRCRHFFASIAPSLLQAVSETPDPDLALVNLDNVTRSLGAKGVLWESLSQHPPLLRLFVQLCSWSQFLSEILITNPGMIDELLDTLVMNREPTRAELSDELALLMKGAEDIRPILHSFKSTTLLGIAIQDILGERTIHQTTQRLSDLAEVILSAMADHHFAELSRKLGLPRVGGPTGPVAAYALIGLGKFGGAELGYHGDIDLMLLYEDDGETVHSEDASRPGTTHFHFFSELLQRMVRTSTEATSGGKLYSLDLRLRPTGRSGSLVYPLFRFETYYQTEAALWERQALTRARVLRANKSFGRRASDAIRRAITARPWQEDDASAILQMRQRLEESRGPTSLKRGRGGQADIEFAVQLAQLRHASDQPTILESNVCKAIDLLQKTGIWNSKRAKLFKEAYTFLRTTEARLRIVYNVARDDLPTDPQELGKLAARCGYASGEKLRAKLEETMAATRSEFLRVVEEARTP